MYLFSELGGKNAQGTMSAATNSTKSGDNTQESLNELSKVWSFYFDKKDIDIFTSILLFLESFINVLKKFNDPLAFVLCLWKNYSK